MVHHMITLRLDGRLHLAPIGPDPGSVCEVGAGTGTWAIQMGGVHTLK